MISTEVKIYHSVIALPLHLIPKFVGNKWRYICLHLLSLLFTQPTSQQMYIFSISHYYITVTMTT